MQFKKQVSFVFLMVIFLIQLYSIPAFAIDIPFSSSVPGWDITNSAEVNYTYAIPILTNGGELIVEITSGSGAQYLLHRGSAPGSRRTFILHPGERALIIVADTLQWQGANLSGRETHGKDELDEDRIAVGSPLKREIQEENKEKQKEQIKRDEENQIDGAFSASFRALSITPTIEELPQILKQGDYETVIRFLIEKHGDLKSKKEISQLLLYLAAELGYDEVITVLCRQELVNLNERSPYEDMNAALHIAVVNRHENVVAVLLDLGADPSITNAKNQTALFLSVGSDSHRSLCITHRLLRSMDTDGINTQTLRGNTPLHHAAYRGKLLQTRLLIKKGANKEIRNSEGKKPEEMADKNPRLKNFLAKPFDDSLASDTDPEDESDYEYLDGEPESIKEPPKTIEVDPEHTLIAHYRGAHFFKDLFSRAERKNILLLHQLQQRGVLMPGSLFSTAAHEIAHLPFTPNLNFETQTTEEINTILEERERQLREASLGVGCQITALQTTGAVRPLLTEGSASSQPEYASRYLELVQCYVNKYTKYKELFSKKNRERKTDGRTSQRILDQLALLNSFTFYQLPFISTSEGPEHPLKYAMASQLDQNQIESGRQPLTPQYQPDGHPRFPYLGIVYVFLHNIDELIEDRSSRILDLAVKKLISVNLLRRGAQKERIFIGSIDNKHICVAAIIRVPNFSHGYKGFYLRKYGLTEEEFNRFKENLSRIRDASEIEQEIIRHIVDFKKRELVQVAAAFAERNGFRIGYLDETGTHAIPASPGIKSFLTAKASPLALPALPMQIRDASPVSTPASPLPHVLSASVVDTPPPANRRATEERLEQLYSLSPSTTVTISGGSLTTATQPIKERSNIISIDELLEILQRIKNPGTNSNAPIENKYISFDELQKALQQTERRKYMGPIEFRSILREMGVGSGYNDETIVPGWSFYSPATRFNNCLFAAVFDQLQLLHYDLMGISGEIDPHIALRVNIQGLNGFTPGQQGDYPDIINLIRGFNVIVAIYDVRPNNQWAGYTYHYAADGVIESTRDISRLPRVPVVRLAYTGDHYMSVHREGSLPPRTPSITLGVSSANSSIQASLPRNEPTGTSAKTVSASLPTPCPVAAPIHVPVTAHINGEFTARINVAIHPIENLDPIAPSLRDRAKRLCNRIESAAQLVIGTTRIVKDNIQTATLEDVDILIRQIDAVNAHLREAIQLVRQKKRVGEIEVPVLAAEAAAAEVKRIADIIIARKVIGNSGDDLVLKSYNHDRDQDPDPNGGSKPVPSGPVISDTILRSQGSSKSGVSGSAPKEGQGQGQSHQSSSESRTESEKSTSIEIFTLKETINNNTMRNNGSLIVPIPIPTDPMINLISDTPPPPFTPPFWSIGIKISNKIKEGLYSMPSRLIDYAATTASFLLTNKMLQTSSFGKRPDSLSSRW